MYTLKLAWATLMVLLIVATTLAADQDAARSLAKDKVQDQVNGSNNYRIGPEDVLDISVWNNTAIARTVPVRPDGKISLPLVNDVQAAGLTPMQLREVLVGKLTAYIPRPEVSVIVREVHSFKVSVIGEVKKAGQYELKSRATVLDLIALAGGLTPFASPSRIVVLRQEGTTTTRIPFNYKKATSSTPPREDVALQPGDVIVVP